MSLSQQKATAIVPKFPSAFSVIGSSSIIWCCLRNKDERLSKTYHRLMLGMSVADVLCSSAWFLTTWPIPKGSPYVWGAVGTQQTCDAQGFFDQLSLSVIMYNGFLSLYYVLVVVYNWKKKAIIKAEKIFHLLAISAGLLTSAVGIPLTLYNNIYGNCWINGLPLNCLESWRNNGETTCERGDNYTLYQWVFFFGPLFLLLVLITATMVLVYRASRRKEKLLQQYVERGGQLANKADSKLILRQCFLYVVGFYISWVPLTILRIIQLVSSITPFWMVMVSSSTFPAQGAFNAIVYLSVSASHEELLV